MVSERCGRQGITTYLSGEGGSPAPRNKETQTTGNGNIPTDRVYEAGSGPAVVNGDTLRWERYSEYFSILERFGIPINVVHNVGLTQVRRVVLGVEDVQPTAEQLERMKELSCATRFWIAIQVFG